MVLWLALFALLSAPACAEEKEADPSRNTVAVVMDFDEEHSPVSLAEMKREFEWIMRPSGLRFDWRFLEPSVYRCSFSGLVVTRFRGACRVLPGRQAAAGPIALGLTHVSDGHILPFSEINCDKVRFLIHPKLVGESFARAELLLGRALARVLAHEFYHMLANTRKHGRSGVAKPVLEPRDLVAGRLQLEQPQARLMRGELGVGDGQQLTLADGRSGGRRDGSAGRSPAQPLPRTSRTAVRTLTPSSGQ